MGSYGLGRALSSRRAIALSSDRDIETIWCGKFRLNPSSKSIVPALFFRSLHIPRLLPGTGQRNEKVTPFLQIALPPDFGLQVIAQNRR